MKKREPKQLATKILLVLNADAIIQQSDLCSQFMFETYMIGEPKEKVLTEKRDSLNSQIHADVDFTHSCSKNNKRTLANIIGQWVKHSMPITKPTTNR